MKCAVNLPTATPGERVERADHRTRAISFVPEHHGTLGRAVNQVDLPLRSSRRSTPIVSPSGPSGSSRRPFIGSPNVRTSEIR